MLEHLTRKLARAALAGALITGATAASAETVLRIKMVGDLKQIDPIWTSNFPVRDMAYLVWDTLFAMDKDYKVQPQMVGKYDVSADGKTYTITLRDGLKWHDGGDVTSEDCIASLERWMTRDPLGGELKKYLDRFESVDAKTFKLMLKEPWGLTLTALAKPSSYVPFMMPARLARTPADKEITQPIGSGPFMMKMDEWQPGAKAVYVKNPNYAPRSEPASFMAGGKIAKVDRIERIHIPDEVSAVNALLAGEIDYMEGVPPDMLPLIERSKDVEMMIRDPLGKSVQVVLNHTQPPFNNIKIRQAVQYALSQKDFQEAYFGDRTKLYKICPAIFFCGAPYETDVNSERYMHQDFEKAKALLKEGGYDGTPIVVLHQSDQKEFDDYMTVAVQALRKAGFVVDDQRIEAAQVFARRASKAPAAQGGWHIFSTGWGGVDLMNPATNVFVTGACDKAWFGWPCDEELQKLRASFFAATTDDQRKQIAIKLQARANEIVTFIPMGQNFIVGARSKKLQGLLDGPVSSFWNATKSN
ncbi:MAG: ABC transporter substrate-binding protein [Rhizobiales bacterium]|nr:ABC transporter substrate-binding protein [Hyphomicrobiales bacterium]